MLLRLRQRHYVYTHPSQCFGTLGTSASFLFPRPTFHVAVMQSTRSCWESGSRDETNPPPPPSLPFSFPLLSLSYAGLPGLSSALTQIVVQPFGYFTLHGPMLNSFRRPCTEGTMMEHPSLRSRTSILTAST